MKSSVVGMTVALIILVMLEVVTPFYYIGIIQWARSENEMMSDVTSLVDKVIDTRQLTDDMLADFNLALAAKPLNYTATITRETRVVNPDPQNPGKTYTTYVLADDISQWYQGDIITVHVETFGESIYTVISNRIMGLGTGQNSFQVSGRVR